MSEKIALNQIRSEALDRVERSERNYKLALYVGGICEALFLLAFVLSADFSNRVHLLLFIATVGSYSVLVLGMVALGAHVNRGNLRVLKALELLKDQFADNKE